MSSKRRIAVGIAWYRPQDWGRLLEISADRDKLESSHAEWVVNANRAIRTMERLRQPCERVIIDLDELLAWCKAHGCPVDGDARATFVSEKMAGN